MSNTLINDLNKKGYTIIKLPQIIDNLKSLNKFYEISPNISKKNFLRKLKSTIYKDYKPYIALHSKKFFIKWIYFINISIHKKHN